MVLFSLAALVIWGQTLYDRDWLGFALTPFVAWFLIPGWYVRLCLFRTPWRVTLSEAGVSLLTTTGRGHGFSLETLRRGVVHEFSWEELQYFRRFGSFLRGATFRLEHAGQRQQTFVVYATWMPRFEEMVADIEARLSRKEGRC
jgi:hypothetical protein